ncbi:MAG TPA: hypothetical protein VFI92_08025 [Steroidobacteraceae bacterium]|nr:hypothetical protein [Steroidobacteraceae bacterium]
MTTRLDREQGPLLHAYCHRCEKWRVLEAEAFTVDFCVESDPPAEALCPDCGEYGLVRVRLPPTRRPAASLLLLEQPRVDPGLLP